MMVVKWLLQLLVIHGILLQTLGAGINLQNESDLNLLSTKNTEQYSTEIVPTSTSESPQELITEKLKYINFPYPVFKKSSTQESSDLSAKIKQVYKEKETWKSIDFQKKIHFLYSQNIMTDCNFIVGSGNDTEEISAHAIVLAVASPVFAKALESNPNFRLPEVSPSDFHQIMNFLYTGELCIRSFEEACSLLRRAANFGLDEVVEIARGYIVSKMYPNHIWHAYQCAQEVKDQDLMDTAFMLIMKFTEKAINDPKFNEISQSDLVEFLSKENLNITKEYHLFEAVVRWALFQASRQKVKATPEKLREIIGPDVLKQVRFLTMSMDEFQQLYNGFRILSYEETLQIMFNINRYNSVNLTEMLSKNNETRKGIDYVDENNSTIFISGVPENCSTDTFSADDTYSVLTSGEIKSKYSYTNLKLRGIQIPKSLEALADNCTSLKEHFDVFVFDQNKKLIVNTTYNQIPPCTVVSYNVTTAEDEDYDDNEIIWQIKQDTNLINVRIPDTAIDYRERYIIKVVFRAPRTLPLTLRKSEYLNNEQRRMHTSSLNFMDYSSSYYQFQPKNSFIYSVILYH